MIKLKLMLKENPTDEIRILEIGAGSGHFAINLYENLKDFTNLKIQYYLTDISKKSLEDLKNSAYFNDNFLFYRLDLNNPEIITSLEDETLETPKEFFHLVIANYVLCNLPPSFIKKYGDKYFEKNIELFQKGEKFPENIKELDIQSNYVKIDLNNYFDNEEETKVFQNYVKDIHGGIINYPSKALKVLKKVMAFIIPNGIFIISDRGCGDKNQYLNLGFKDLIHEGSISTHLNFIILEMFLRELGYSSVRTTNNNFLLHTMLIYKNQELNDELKKQFEDIFTFNLNNKLLHFYEKARELINLEKYQEALQNLEEIYKFMPNEPLVLYLIGICHLKCNNNLKALKFLHQGKQEDTLNFFDFDLNLGICFFNMGKTQNALNYFQESLKKHPDSSLAKNFINFYELKS